MSPAWSFTIEGKEFASHSIWETSFNISGSKEARNVNFNFNFKFTAICYMAFFSCKNIRNSEDAKAGFATNCLCPKIRMKRGEKVEQ